MCTKIENQVIKSISIPSQINIDVGTMFIRINRWTALIVAKFVDKHNEVIFTIANLDDSQIEAFFTSTQFDFEYAIKDGTWVIL